MEHDRWIQLVKAVYVLRGGFCAHCRSEVDLQAYQFRYAADEDKKPTDFIILCESCKVKRRKRDMKADKGDWRMLFGKHKGRLISECPIRYLDWLIGQGWLRPALKRQIEKYLEGCPEWQRM